MTVTNAVNATLYKSLNFDIVRDLAPITGAVQTANVLAVNPSVPAKTVPEFIAYAKAIRARSIMRRLATVAPPTWRRAIQDDDRGRFGPCAI